MSDIQVTNSDKSQTVEVDVQIPLSLLVEQYTDAVDELVQMQAQKVNLEKAIEVVIRKEFPEFETIEMDIQQARVDVALAKATMIARALEVDKDALKQYGGLVRQTKQVVTRFDPEAAVKFCRQSLVMRLEQGLYDIKVKQTDFLNALKRGNYTETELEDIIKVESEDVIQVTNAKLRGFRSAQGTDDE